MAVEFRYKGRQGRRQRLVDANDMMVVRTARRDSLGNTPLGLDARRSIANWSTVARFDEAGVEVLEVPPGPRRKTRRDDARTILKQEPEVAFAGRVLRGSNAHSPVIYTENLFIKFADDASARTRQQVLKAHLLHIKRPLEIAANAFFVEADDNVGREVFDIAAALLEREAVELCHPEMVRAAGDRQAFPEQWHLQATEINRVPVDEHAHVVDAWALTRGEGVTIAVIDDGFDVDHVEFSGAGKIVSPWDATRRRENARPQFRSERHGTPCAGIACANGSHGASGVAPAARLMPIRLRSGVGSVNEAEAIRWAVDHGADVISCSWGPPDGDWTNPDDPAHQDKVELPDHTRLALEYAVTRGRGGRGCVIAWAAGNGGEPVENDGYASSPLVLTVGASNDRGTRAPYSDFGEPLWCVFPSDHKLPSFTPGIWTTDREAGAGYNPGRSRLGDADGHYTNGFGGTSAACPGAAGVAALVLARNPDLTWRAVRQVLAETCEPIDQAGGEYVNGKSPYYGFGRLHARRAVEHALPERAARTLTHRVTSSVPIRDRATVQVDLEVTGDGLIDALRVDVDIEHTHRGDLVLKLLPPAGLGLEAVVLHEREGRWRDDIKRVYDRMDVPALATLNGQSARGTWTLEAADLAREDEGRINHFGLEIDLRP